jgi:F-type H+-transporting ATPase subunit delta
VSEARTPGERAQAYADSFLEVARAEGIVAGVEDDLFRFARTFEGNEPLRLALTDPALPPTRRIAVVEELMGGKALPTSTALAMFTVAAGRASELPAIVDAFVEKAAAERDHEVAEVRTAVALDDAQQSRLADALARATGKRIELKVVVDPSVLGGIVTRIGDTVIDGSVRHRLDQLKEQL